MANDPWLELRSAPGLGASFLVENRPAYEVFDVCDRFPQLVLAIGGATKRGFLQGMLPRKNQNHYGGVRLRLLSTAITLADCEIHHQPARQLESTDVAGHQTRHRLKSISPNSPGSRIYDWALALYWQVVAPFCSLVILFAEDLGGLSQITETLRRWAALPPMQFTPRIVVLYRDSIDRTCQISPFGPVRFLPLSIGHAVLCHSQAAARDRDSFGLNFSTQHGVVLLQESVRQFGHEKPFNFYDASRMNHPLPGKLETHLASAITVARLTHAHLVNFLASALVFNAYPPGMHFFLPQQVFDRFYGQPLALACGQPGLVASARSSFVRIAKHRKGLPGPGEHLKLLKTVSWGAWSLGLATCLICAAESAVNTLSCRHRLCAPCTTICGSSEVSEPWRYRIRHCPLCQQSNEASFLLKPPTAGLRVLALEGTILGRYTILRFLKDLRACIGLTCLAFPEHFDLIMGFNIGAFFVKTIFVEDWSFEECFYHLKNIRYLKIDQRSSTISFGKTLRWDLSETKLSNTADTILDIYGCRFSSTLGFLPDAHEGPKKPDITVWYEGGVYRKDHLRAIGSRLFASLFYIELLQLPRFYQAPEWIALRLCCRLPPGPPLMDLISGLYRENKRLYYRSDSQPYQVRSLVTRDILGACRQGAAFSCIIELKAGSLHSKLDICIDGSSSELESISNCPYVLQELIKDQSLQCAFGTKDYWSLRNNTRSDNTLQAIERLRQTLDRFL